MCVFLHFYSGQIISVSVSYYVLCVFPLCYRLVVSTSPVNCLEKLVSEMTCYVSSGTLNPTHLTCYPVHCYVYVTCLCVCRCRALGLGATRGRLYIKHPDIFKVCDYMQCCS